MSHGLLVLALLLPPLATVLHVERFVQIHSHHGKLFYCVWYIHLLSTITQRATLMLEGASVCAKTALLQVLVSLRTPDDMGRTNFQVGAVSNYDLFL